jgi:signal peptidase I
MTGFFLISRFTAPLSVWFLQGLAAAISALLLAQPALAFCLCLKCATGTFKSFQPLAGSMKPAIEPGACVIVKNGASVNRGSIIVFRHPVLSDTVYVKRLIGIPGDTVEIRDGVVYLNGEALLQSAVGSYAQQMRPEGPNGLRPVCPGSVPDGATCQIPKMSETLPDGTSWEILDLGPAGFADDFGPVTVSADLIFVLGDHRDNSADSRVPQEAGGVGFVPMDNIVGPVVEITNP